MSAEIETNLVDNAKSAQTITPKSKCANVNSRFELYGWQPDPNLSDDENYMDLVMLVTRNSICLQGYMGCVIVNPDLSHTLDVGCSSLSPQYQHQHQEYHRQKIYHNIIGASTNLPLFTESDSDIHAEIGALGQCNQYGKTTKGSIAYITMPPCKRCFAALLSAGVTKIVAQQRHPDVILQTAKKHGIVMVDMGIEYKAQQHTRVEELICKVIGDTDKSEERKELLFERRKRRKEQRQAKKHAKVERRNRMLDMQKGNSGPKSSIAEDADT